MNLSLCSTCSFDEKRKLKKRKQRFVLCGFFLFSCLLLYCSPAFPQQEPTRDSVLDFTDGTSLTVTDLTLLPEKTVAKDAPLAWNGSFVSSRLSSPVEKKPLPLAGIRFDAGERLSDWDLLLAEPRTRDALVLAAEGHLEVFPGQLLEHNGNRSRFTPDGGETRSFPDKNFYGLILAGPPVSRETSDPLWQIDLKDGSTFFLPEDPSRSSGPWQTEVASRSLTITFSKNELLRADRVKDRGRDRAETPLLPTITLPRKPAAWPEMNSEAEELLTEPARSR